MRVLGIALPILVALAGCAEDDDRIRFDGQVFRTKATKDADDRSYFKVSVNRPEQSLAGARAAGTHEAIRYCIENYGTSVIDWSDGPDVADDALVIDRGALELRGRCLA